MKDNFFIKPVPKPRGRIVAPTRLMSKEEAELEIYMLTELEKLGYNMSECYSDIKGFDEKKYLHCVTIAARCIRSNQPIPDDVKKYMLKVKAIKEGGSNDKEC